MASCEFCDREFGEELPHSLIEPALCRSCACDPVLPKESAWWTVINVYKAKWEAGLRRGLWAANLWEAYLEAADSHWTTPYDDCLEREAEHLREEYNSKTGFDELVECWATFEQKDLEEARKTDKPFDHLGELGYFNPEEMVWAHAQENIEILINDIQKDDDLEVAGQLGVVSIGNRGIWGILETKACEEGNYQLGNLFWRMSIAQEIQPRELSFDLYCNHDGGYEYDAIIGVCTSCYSPFNGNDLELDFDYCATLCKECNERLNLRAGRLTWLHITGRLPVDPKILEDPELTWLLWPQELQEKMHSGHLVPERNW